MKADAAPRARAASPAASAALFAAVALLATVVLTGCETTAEKSAALERAAKLRGAAGGAAGLVISRPSTTLRVVQTALVGGREGAAAVVTLRNTAPRAAYEVPIALTVKGAGGAVAYTNTTPGIAHTLVSVPFVAAGAETSWVDDQLPPQATGGTVTATVGQAPALASAAPALAVGGVKPYEDPANGVGLEGTVTNHSAVAQRELVIFAIARGAHGLAAAGRAVLPLLPARATTRFQVFWVGAPAGAHVEVTAPPTTLR